MEATEGTSSSPGLGLFDTPGKCEGCERPENRVYVSYGEERTDRAYIRWMPLLEAFLCSTCIEAYSRWACEPMEGPPEDRNYRVPLCVRAIEARNAHKVVPLDAHVDTWRCSCGEVFTVEVGYAVCPAKGA